MASKIFVCAGMNRSGSTWQFNAVMAALRSIMPHDEVYGAWIGEYDASNPASAHVVKAHDPEDIRYLTADVILSSCRDLRAVAGSLIRMKWSSSDREQLWTHLDRYVESFSVWRGRSRYVMQYEMLIADPQSVLCDIIRVCDIDICDDDLPNIIDHLSDLQPESGHPSGTILTYDKSSLLHRGHIGDIQNELAVKRLSPQLITDLEIRYYPWLLQQGYIDSESTLHATAFSLKKQIDTGILERDRIVESGTSVFFRAGELPCHIHTFGFDVEEWGMWSTAALCQIQFNVGVESIQDIVMHVGALTPRGTPPLVVTAFVNGHEIDTWYWRDSTDAQKLSFSVKDKNGAIVISFLIKGARSVKSLGIGEDERTLGIAVHSLSLNSIT